MLTLVFTFYFCLYFQIGLQICPEEITDSGISVKWEKSIPANDVKSYPLCYNNDRLITRNCVGTEWVPAAADLKPCLQVVNHYNLSACPPGFDKISKYNNDYCYQIKESQPWDYPCLKSGGASVITDLGDEDVTSLLNSLAIKNVSRYFWLPAKRLKFFGPIVWQIPGSKWGRSVESNNKLNIRGSFFKNCLLLDVEQQILVIETCAYSYPSLCFYINDIHHPAKCPPKYHAIRYMPDEGVCLGIEVSRRNMTYNNFINRKLCNSAMGDKDGDDLTRFIFKQIAKLNNLPDNVWCWFASSHIDEENYINSSNSTNSKTYVSINNIGTLTLINSTAQTVLPCMACQTEVIYGDTELMFEYNKIDNIIYLTIYFPSGLWKYNEHDRGVQCFSDAKGFVKVIDIEEMPFFKLISNEKDVNLDSQNIEKIVYTINLITDRAAQYWCEGHTNNFSLIKTEKLVVNPQGYDVHVFSLVINTYVSNDDIHYMLDEISSELVFNIRNIFSAKKVLLMDYLEYNSSYLMVLLHMDITIQNFCNNNAKNIERTFNITRQTAEEILPNYTYNLVNLSSCMYCLPTTSVDNSIILNWELTSIGHIAAPKEFCLQENGLPVRRLCTGSYLLGSYWSNVEGTCDQNYQPSSTTTFLYNFVKGLVDENDTSRFLTAGLSFVLHDIGIIIPADIYYLSMSLQHIVNIVQANRTTIEMGNIDNTAWVMDRVMVFNNNYLRLAQTLNSTNVILDSLDNIIEILAHKENKVFKNMLTDRKTDYKLAVQPQVIIQVSCPDVNNISGIALIKSLKSRSDIFTNMEIRPLFKNTTLEEVLAVDNLEIATWLPEKTINDVKKNKNESIDEKDEQNMKIIITVFHNDAIFQELETNQNQINSRIIGISLPGYISNLRTPVPIIYKDLLSTTHEKFCGYWDFQTQAVGNVPGYWSKKGCILKKSQNNLTVCNCYHLTHFGQLLNLGRHKNISDPLMRKHTKSLNIISLVGSFLSLLGIMGIWITASVFYNWRKKAGTKVLLHLTTSIALPLLFMIVFNLDDTIFKEQDGIYVVAEELIVVCITLGALLHYSVLASFMWMLITAILQFVRYVRVLGVYRPSRFMIKFTIVGWGTPLIPVIVVLSLDKENYIPNAVNAYEPKSLICYPNGFYLYVSVIVPISVILLINIILFILVIWSISKGPDGKMRATDIDLIGAQLRLSIFLFFLLGLTWIFGVLSFSNKPLWSYLFCLTSTMQGFVLFIYFIICDSQTRNLWVTLMKPQFRQECSRKSITSISSN